MVRKKEEVITFKTDGALLSALKQMPNRSEFIRTALLAAMDNLCPLCNGRGVLSPSKKEHWDEFARNHPLQECGDCHEVTLVCEEKH